MSSLWTPGGEHPVEPASDDAVYDPADDPEYDQDMVDEVQARMEEVRKQLLHTPAATVIANHVMGFYELGAIHLSATPPNLDEARLAVDAMGLMVETLGDRLAEQETLTDALAQLRMAYVQISQGLEAETEAAEDADGAASSDSEGSDSDASGSSDTQEPDAE
jgi:hypothetical protein